MNTFQYVVLRYLNLYNRFVMSERKIKKFEYKELVFDGAVSKGYRVGLKMHDGKIVDRDYFEFSGAAVILPVLDDGSVVLIKNYRFAVDEYLYEFPAGMLEENEDPKECASRELIEETGYRAEKIEKLGEFYAAPGTMNEKMYVYLATGLVDGLQNLEIYEDITVEVVSMDKIKEMLLDGTIHDAKTIAAFGLYNLKLDTDKR